MVDSSVVTSLDQLVARIADGTKLAVPADQAGPAIAATRALIARGIRNLHLVCMPTSGLQADLLIGAGTIATIETSAVTLGEFGAAPQFQAAVKAGRLDLKDATCPAIYSALQAAEKGIPFIPMRGLIGSDVLRYRPDWKVIDNPFQPGDAIALLPAIKPDVCLFHVGRADRFGNVWVGHRRDLATLARASAVSLVTAERIEDSDLMADPVTAAGTLPGLYVSALAAAPLGAWPIGLADHYPADADAMRRYARMARQDDGFAQWLADPGPVSAAA